MKTFSNWTIVEVEAEFGIEQTEENGLLDSWMTVESQPSPTEQHNLERLQKLLLQRVYDWNEYELSFNFIGPLLTMIDFNKKTYRAFMERELSVPYGDGTLSGTVDFVVAQGRRVPERPFFFIHEYKRERDKNSDPLGQLMIEMVAAQILNQDEGLLYGAYVVGRYWHFVVLDGKDYAVHRGLNAASAELNTIFGVLKNTEAILDRMSETD
ncbi:hypothetical protein KFU94_12020 [Chloroflexi bacterium TSY]|nr:hypothetical protein [Chloroflexi bacterium TSY]